MVLLPIVLGQLPLFAWAAYSFAECSSPRALTGWILGYHVDNTGFISPDLHMLLRCTPLCRVVCVIVVCCIRLFRHAWWSISAVLNGSLLLPVSLSTAPLLVVVFSLFEIFGFYGTIVVTLFFRVATFSVLLAHCAIHGTYAG